MAKDWSLAKWEKGQVTLLQAFGIKKGTISFPKLQAILPTEAAQAAQNQAPSNTGTAPVNAKNYSQKQLQALWIQAGGDPAKALIASAIAEAESGGKSSATDDDSNGTQDRGLWQINSVHGHLSTFDPLKNARSAIQISDNGTNWSAWTTFNTGAYLQYM